MVTFVQATYALVTCVQISNISTVSGSILTKLFGPNLCGVIFFVDQNVLGQNFFKTQNFILRNPPRYGQMSRGQKLPGQMLPLQLESVLDVPKNLPLKFHQDRASNS